MLIAYIATPAVNATPAITRLDIRPTGISLLVGDVDDLAIPGRLILETLENARSFSFVPKNTTPSTIPIKGTFNAESAAKLSITSGASSVRPWIRGFTP